MEDIIDYKRLYELSIIEKEKFILENEKLKLLIKQFLLLKMARDNYLFH